MSILSARESAPCYLTGDSVLLAELFIPMREATGLLEEAVAWACFSNMKMSHFSCNIPRQLCPVASREWNERAIYIYPVRSFFMKTPSASHRTYLSCARVKWKWTNLFTRYKLIYSQAKFIFIFIGRVHHCHRVLNWALDHVKNSSITGTLLLLWASSSFPSAKDANL